MLLQNPNKKKMNQKIEQPNKYLLYARKSSESEDKQMLSVESQVKEMKRVAANSAIEISEIRDESHSAKNPGGRPIFNQVLKDIESGKFQGLVVWHVDRLSRNSVDTGKIIHLMDLGKLKEIIAQGQTFRNTPSDKFFLNLLCSQAKLENDNKSINVKRGLKQKAENGWCPNMSALGYTYNPLKKKGEKEIIKDPERFDLVKKMWKMVIAGKYTPKEVYDLATQKWGLRNRKGGKVALSAWYAMLHNSFYYGWFEFPVGSGNWHQGKHEPMISQTDFEKIRALLGQKGTTRPQKYTFTYTGIMRCDCCGAMITAENKVKKCKNGKSHFYTYYHCTRRKDPNCIERKVIEEKALEEQIVEFIKSVDIPPGFKDFAVRHFKKNYAPELEASKRIRESQIKTLEATEGKISKLLDMHLNNQLSEAEFTAKKAELRKEQEDLEITLANSSIQKETWLERLQKTFNIAEDIWNKFENGDPRDKKQIVSKLGSSLTLKDRQFTIEPGNPILRIKQVASTSQAIYKKMEPLKPDKERLALAYSTSPTLRKQLNEIIEKK